MARPDRLGVRNSKARPTHIADCHALTTAGRPRARHGRELRRRLRPLLPASFQESIVCALAPIYWCNAARTFSQTCRHHREFRKDRWISSFYATFVVTGRVVGSSGALPVAKLFLARDSDQNVAFFNMLHRINGQFISNWPDPPKLRFTLYTEGVQPT